MNAVPTGNTEQSGEPRLLIDGKLVESESGKTFDNVNPATEEVLGVPISRSLPTHSSMRASALLAPFNPSIVKLNVSR